MNIRIVIGGFVAADYWDLASTSPITG